MNTIKCNAIFTCLKGHGAGQACKANNKQALDRFFAWGHGSNGVCGGRDRTNRKRMRSKERKEMKGMEMKGIEWKGKERKGKEMKGMEMKGMEWK